MWKLTRQARRWQSSVALHRDTSIQDSVRELYGSMCRSLDNDKKKKLLRSSIPLFVQEQPWPVSRKDRADGIYHVESLTSGSIIEEDRESMASSLQEVLVVDKFETKTTFLSSSLSIQDDSDSEEDQPKSMKSSRDVVEPTETQERTELKYLVYDKKDGLMAMKPFRRMVSNGVSAHYAIIRDLFRLLLARHCPFEAYEVLQYYLTIPTSMEYLDSDGNINGYLKFYERLCDILRYVGSSTKEDVRGKRLRTKEEAYRLVDAVASDLVRLDRKGRTLCYPNFVSAMVDQRWVALGHQFAGPFYQQILDEDLEVKPGWWHHILTISKRNRQTDLPFADVAYRSVFHAGIRPSPCVVLHALDNLYPFTDLDAVETFLEVLLHLQNESNKLVTEHQQNVYRYDVDIATLNSITAAAAGQGNSEVCLLACNYLESLGREASEAMFENTICAFASSPFTYQQAFTILSKMEQSVYSVQRPLIRTISTQLRIRARDLDFAHEVIRQLALEGVAVSASMLNILLSAAAERGDLGRAVDLYCEFDNNGLAPNADTFSFVFEAIGKHLRTRLPRNQAFRERNTAALSVTAATFVERMEQHSIIANTSILRNYIEVLVATGQKEKATSIVFGARDSNIPLDSKTIYLVAMMNARDGKFDIARKVAEIETAASRVLLKNIQREEELAEVYHSQQNEVPLDEVQDLNTVATDDDLSVETLTQDGEVS